MCSGCLTPNGVTIGLHYSYQRIFYACHHCGKENLMDVTSTPVHIKLPDNCKIQKGVKVHGV